MASGRITIPIGLETTGVQKGAKDAEKALGDLDDAVSDAGKSGGKDLDKIEDELKDVQKQSKKTGSSVGRELDDGFDKAKKGADDFKSEAQSTSAEVAASFDGSIDSIAGGFQELTANALSGFGPAGAAAGAAIALGLGAAFTAIQTQQQALDDLRTKFADVYREAAEDGRDYLSEAQIQSGVLDQLFDPTDNFKKRRTLEEDARKLGVDAIDLARARAGSEEDVNDVIDQGTRKAKELNDEWHGMPGTVSAAGQEVQFLTDDLKAQRAVQDENSEAAKRYKENQKTAQREAQAEVQKTKDALHAMATGTYTPTVKMKLDDAELKAKISTYQNSVITIPATVQITGRKPV